jgi:hypothetical protein
MFLEFCYSLILGLSQTKETVTKGDILNASTGINFEESLKKLQDLFPHFDWEFNLDTVQQHHPVHCMKFSVISQIFLFILIHCIFF